MSWVIAGRRVPATGTYRKVSARRYEAVRQEHINRSVGARRGWATWKLRAARLIAERDALAAKERQAA